MFNLQNWCDGLVDRARTIRSQLFKLQNSPPFSLTEERKKNFVKKWEEKIYIYIELTETCNVLEIEVLRLNKFET